MKKNTKKKREICKKNPKYYNRRQKEAETLQTK